MCLYPSCYHAAFMYTIRSTTRVCMVGALWTGREQRLRAAQPRTPAPTLYRLRLRGVTNLLCVVVVNMQLLSGSSTQDTVRSRAC